MPRYKETPRYHVVSTRVSDAERLSLQQLAEQNALSISDLLRLATQVLTCNNSPAGQEWRLS